MSHALPRLLADWPAPSGIVAFTTLRGAAGSGDSRPPFDHFNLGANCGDDPAVVAANRARLRAAADLPAEPLWLQQVHGVDVVRIAGRIDPVPDPAPLPRADAAVSDVPGTVLAILSADCLPIVFCALDGSEIGAAHAGWRGLAAGVIENTVAAMCTAPGELLAWLGPAAGPQAYEIGDEVRNAFLAHDAAADVAFTSTRPGHWRLDLYAVARQRLAAVGVTRVHGGGLCTISDPQRFFSHRRDGRSGRMATLIGSTRRG
jgi:YfiH family protein